MASLRREAGDGKERSTVTSPSVDLGGGVSTSTGVANRYGTGRGMRDLLVTTTGDESR
jgi:hypothetical protein